LKDGRIEQVGTPMELYKKPANLFVAQFIGSPAMNILSATIERAGTSTAVRLPRGECIEVKAGTAVSSVGETVHLGIRPQDLCLAEGSDDKGVLEGRLDYVEQLGEVQLAYVDIGRADHPLIAKLPGNQAVTRGASLRLTVNPANFYLFSQDGRSLAPK
jgi:multiple sugar transport system ATP-binding protein/alpha-glucoside transport system ATP-binding protein